ncbi:MAG: DUF2946 family protein [Pseudomonas sp.]|uniref:DUF2946 family protein n=1 Tax=Pseudomonas sp. TaxID=306 RepID=UPI002725ADAB|nr:DUF2946 family protein [Pseudomonas sp.]MDO9618472.1 DUF2946 family protein [Pseudomonas sp.]MDP2444951.1 DUF2946 family protein [Pseudomonas sp.]MDZ4332828.1 DUF2946 family protein [Pseudomonas sp.]
MTIARQPRALIAWMLYACVLFNLLACGIAHGQMAGLQLSGLGALTCAGDGAGGESAGAAGALPGLASFSCPLCTSMVLGMALLFALAWMQRRGRALRLAVPLSHQVPPRYLWPSANPRASPQI